MSKSIKLKNNNYWDTEGITHDRRTLKEILNKTPISFNTARKNSSNVWAKIATVTSNGTYAECNTVFLVKGKHNTNGNKAAIINVSLSTGATAGVISKASIEILCSTLNFSPNDVYLEYKGESGEATANIWLNHNMQNYVSWSVTVLENNNWCFPLESTGCSIAAVPSSGYTGIHPTTCESIQNTNATYDIRTKATLKNGIVTLTIDCTNLKVEIPSGSLGASLIQLPENYRPQEILNTTIETTSGHRFLLQIRANGVVAISYVYTNIPSGISSQIRTMITYTAK